MKSQHRSMLARSLEELIVILANTAVPVDVHQQLVTAMIQRELLGIIEIEPNVRGKILRMNQKLEFIKSLLERKNDIYPHPPYEDILKEILLKHFFTLFDDVFSGNNTNLLASSEIYFSYLRYLSDHLTKHHDLMKERSENMTLNDAKKIIAYVQIVDNIHLLDGKVVGLALNILNTHLREGDHVNTDMYLLVFQAMQTMMISQDEDVFVAHYKPRPLGNLNLQSVSEDTEKKKIVYMNASGLREYFEQIDPRDDPLVIQRMRIRKADLSGIDFVEKKVNFKDCDLTGSDFSGSKLECSGEMVFDNIKRDEATKIIKTDAVSAFDDVGMFSGEKNQDQKSDHNKPSPF